MLGQEKQAIGAGVGGERYDFAVIGAGIAGLLAAWRLTQGGHRVLVVDRAESLPAGGGAASGASGAMLVPSFETAGQEAALHRLGLAGRAAWTDLAREIEAAADLSIGFRASGALYAEAWEGDLPEGLRRLDGDAARRIEPCLAASVSGAVWDEGAALVDPVAVLRALLRAFEGAGGRIRLGAGAALGEVGLTLAGARSEATHAIVAAGAWSAALLRPVLPYADRLARPVKGQMLSLVLPGGAPAPRSLVWGHGVYIIPEADGRILIGATQEEAGFDQSTDDKADALRAHAEQLVPCLGGAEETGRWAGFRPASQDGMPVIGGGKGLTVITGQFRNGYLFAPILADWTVAHATGQSLPPEAAVFDLERFAS